MEGTPYQPTPEEIEKAKVTMTGSQEWASELREKWVSSIKEKGLTPENCFLEVMIEPLTHYGVIDNTKKWGPLTRVEQLTIEGVINGEQVVMELGIHHTRVYPGHESLEKVLFKGNQPALHLNTGMVKKITVGENTVSGDEARKLANELASFIHPYINYGSLNYNALRVTSTPEHELEHYKKAKSAYFENTEERERTEERDRANRNN